MPEFLKLDMLAHPEWSTALLVLGTAVGATLLCVGFLHRRRRRRLLARGEKPLLRTLQSDTLLFVALALLVVALLGPPLGSRTIEVAAGGVDVVFVIDVSHSMDARDVPPSRLARAVRGAEELLGRLLPSDRAALAVFAGNGALLTPLTPDRDVIANLLSSLDTDWMVPASSDVAVGIRAALPAFEAGSLRPRTIFVLSDGEIRRGVANVATEAARAEVRIFAAGIGTELGANVPHQGGVLRDTEGNVVVSRRSTEVLEALTSPGGGTVYTADEWGVFDYESAVTDLRRDAGSAPGERVERRVPISAARPLAALAALLLLAEGAPFPRRRRSRRRTAAALGAMGMLGLLGAASPETDHSLDSLDSLEALEARANAAPENARLQIALGAAYFTRGHTDAAKHAFFAATLATSDPGVAAIATYDLGVADLQGGDLEAARDAFFDALAIAPNAPVSRRARYNLEWTLRALSVRPPEEEHSEPVESSGFQTPTPNQDEEEQQEDERSRSGDEPGLPGSVSTPRRLSAMERERWLERIEDHTGEALRGGLGSTGLSPPKKAGEPAW